MVQEVKTYRFAKKMLKKVSVRKSPFSKNLHNTHFKTEILFKKLNHEGTTVKEIVKLNQCTIKKNVFSRSHCGKNGVSTEMFVNC